MGLGGSQLIHIRVAHDLKYGLRKRVGSKNFNISEFLNDQTTNKYHSIKYIGPEAKMKEPAARNKV
jgi:hypothetical protein